MVERFQQFTLLITKLNRAIRRLKTDEMEDFQLKSPHVSCLHYIYRCGSLTLKQLCEICGEDKAAVSRSVEYLKETGFVEMVCKQSKKYKNLINLTEKGINVAKKLADKIDEVICKASEGITDKEREIMYRCLNLISNNLEKIQKNEEK